MSEAHPPAGLRDVLERRPLLAHAAAVAFGIAVYELLRFLGPAVPAWLTPVVASGIIAYGVVLTVQRIRRPLSDERRDAGWAAAPAFIVAGALILILKFVSE